MKPKNKSPDTKSRQILFKKKLLYKNKYTNNHKSYNICNVRFSSSWLVSFLSSKLMIDCISLANTLAIFDK